MTRTRNKILVSGKPDEYQKGGTYEKISADSEFVAGRIGAKGSVFGELKLFETGDVPICVFDKQEADMGRNADGDYDNDFAIHDGSVDALFGDFVFKGCLKDGEVVVAYDLLEAETITGKLLKLTTGIPCAWALKDASPSGSDDDKMIAAFIPKRAGQLQYTEEALTSPTTHVFGLAHTPVIVSYVEATTATTAGPKLFGFANTTPAAQECYIDTSTPDIEFNATDAVTVAVIGYWY